MAECLRSKSIRDFSALSDKSNFCSMDPVADEISSVLSVDRKNSTQNTARLTEEKATPSGQFRSSDTGASVSAVAIPTTQDAFLRCTTSHP
ncbi:hypothetical protein SAMN04487941_0276 [Pontibacter akesuensis]|uniref:Uncharacterized protein n=1 Tax=Pontibacter akesuensis TaxID=388950 RepID=A0A1I7FKK8_9BACT|nr:hypothetical protein SAMN04487941_0276 [Pontibacter akesuensis]